MLDVNVMFAPHHGSNSSSSAEFLESTSSEVVIFSAGFLNRWRHPRNEVQKRYNLEGSESFSTAENGMLMVEFTDTGYHVYRYRQDLWPFWFAN